jgi:beta-lactamase class D
VKILVVAMMFSLFAISATRAEVICTLVVDAASGAVRVQEGGCDVPAAPASTFKTALALMGFDSGILTAPDAPAWPYQNRYNAGRAEWKVTTTPRSWLRDSVLWFSRELTAKLGADRFDAYVEAFEYGNADVSGDPGRNNGLTHSWLNSSLKVTPAEQVTFLRRMVAGELPVSPSARDTVMAIMPKFTAGAWTVSGKTGTYYERHGDGSFNTERQLGWFAGWAERGEERLVFAYLIRDTKRKSSPAGPRARDALLQRFVSWGDGLLARRTKIPLAEVPGWSQPAEQKKRAREGPFEQPVLAPA